MNYLDLLNLAGPETIVVVVALAVLAIDLTTMRELGTRWRFIVSALIASVGCAGAILWMIVMPTHTETLGGMLVANPTTQFVKICLLVLTVFTMWISVDSNFTTHVGEFLALILMAAAGMMFLVSAQDILMIFIALELTSLSLYILAAFDKRNIKSAEAALKYFLFGGMSAAFMLFGLSLIYGLSNSTNLTQIATAPAGKGLDPLLIVAMVMIVIGFGFKIAAVPFHLWAPDAYQGAPAPSAAFIASGSKLASFFILAQVVMLGFKGIEGSAAYKHFVVGWVPLIAVVAGLSMLLGNLVAIVQSHVKRLLAYSAIAHAGYMLLAIMAHDEQVVPSLIYYAVTYGLTVIGAFGVVGVIENGAGDDKFASFAGLSRRAPVVSFCMMIFMLSLAGIPPLAGFFGKFYVFTAVLKSGSSDLGLLWLVVFAIAMSAISFYYYLQVLKQIYIVEPQAGTAEIRPSCLTQAVLLVMAILVVILGAMPKLILGPLLAGTTPAGH